MQDRRSGTVHHARLTRRETATGDDVAAKVWMGRRLEWELRLAQLHHDHRWTRDRPGTTTMAYCASHPSEPTDSNARPTVTASRATRWRQGLAEMLRAATGWLLPGSRSHPARRSEWT